MASSVATAERARSSPSRAAINVARARCGRSASRTVRTEAGCGPSRYGRSRLTITVSPLGIGITVPTCQPRPFALSQPWRGSRPSSCSGTTSTSRRKPAWFLRWARVGGRRGILHERCEDLVQRGRGDPARDVARPGREHHAADGMRCEAHVVQNLPPQLGHEGRFVDPVGQRFWHRITLGVRHSGHRERAGALQESDELALLVRAGLAQHLLEVGARGC